MKVLWINVYRARLCRSRPSGATSQRATSERLAFFRRFSRSLISLTATAFQRDDTAMNDMREQIHADPAQAANQATAPLTCDLALAQPTERAGLGAHPATQPARVPRTEPQPLADQLVADELIKGAPSRNGGRLLTAERDPWTHNAWCARRLQPRPPPPRPDSVARTGTKSSGDRRRKRSRSRPSSASADRPSRNTCRTSSTPTRQPSGTRSTRTTRVSSRVSPYFFERDR